MRFSIFALVLIAALAPSAQAYCTTSGQPGMVMLASHVLEIMDDDAYKQGRTVWVPGGVKADSQLFAWLVWTDRVTGQGCVVTLKERRNDHCGPRLDVQFQQRTAYNVGFAASDMPGVSTAYPYRCTTELVFHIFDSGQMVPNPAYDPNDPFSPQFIVDPGFDFYTLIQLDVTGEHYTNPGGMPSVPDGVTRNGECPDAQPDDEFPAFMLTGPNCAGNIRRNSASSGATVSAASWQAMTAAASKTSGGLAVQSVQGSQSAGAVAKGASAPQRQSAASIRMASKAKLTAMLDKVAANTVKQGGRPILRAKVQ